MKRFAVLLSLVAAVSSQALCPGTDSIFIIDSSQSITKRQFENIKTYASNFVDIFDIGTGANQAQFGGMIFNQDVRVKWNLNAHTTAQDLKSYLSQLTYTSDATNLGTAFSQAEAILTGAGARPTACKGVVLFTDGRYDAGENPVPLAEKLRDDLGATVISVAVEGINGNLDPYDYEMLVQLSGSESLVFVMPNNGDAVKAAQHHGQMKKALLKA